MSRGVIFALERWTLFFFVQPNRGTCSKILLQGPSETNHNNRSTSPSAKCHGAPANGVVGAITADFPQCQQNLEIEQVPDISTIFPSETMTFQSFG